MNSELHGLTDFWKEPWTASTWGTWSSQGPASQGLQSSLWMYTSYAPSSVENDHDFEPFPGMGTVSSSSRVPSPEGSPPHHQSWLTQRIGSSDYSHQHQPQHQHQQYQQHQQFGHQRNHPSTISPATAPLTPPGLSPQHCGSGLALPVSRAPARPRRSSSLDSESSSLSASSSAGSTMFQIGGYRTVELLPTAQQRQTLQKWFGVVRWTHNRAVDALRSDPNATPTSLRAAVAQAEADHDWAAAVPLAIRDATVAQLIGALHLAQRSAEVAAAATGENVPMEPIGTAAVNSALKYRTRKDRLEHVVLRADGFQSGIPYPDHFGYAPLASSAPIPDRLENDAILVRSTERFYLCIPEPSSDRRESCLF